MRTLLISLGVVAMMFFAQASVVNAKTCDQKAEVRCETEKDGLQVSAIYCCANITCNNTSAADKATMCNKHCSKTGNEADATDCNQEND